jgi:hypothetical protein
VNWAAIAGVIDSILTVAGCAALSVQSWLKRSAELSHTAQQQPRLVVWIVFRKKFCDDFAAFPNEYWFAR